MSILDKAKDGIAKAVSAVNKGVEKKPNVKPSVVPEDLQGLVANIPTMFTSYQAQINEKKKTTALLMAYVSGSVERGLTHNGTDSQYEDLYPNMGERGVLNYPVNYLIDPVRSLTSVMINAEPPFNVNPGQSQDDRRKNVALIAEEAMTYHDNQVFNSKHKNIILYSLGVLSGTAYRELYIEDDSKNTYWDAGEGRVVKDGRVYDGKGALVEGVTPVKKTQKRLQTGVCSIWDIAHSMDAPDGLADGCAIQVRRTTKTIGYLKTVGDVAAIEKELEPIMAPVVSEFVNDVRAAKGSQTLTPAPVLTGDDRQIQCLYAFHKPTVKYAKGWVCLMDMKGKAIAWWDKLPGGVMPIVQLDTNTIDIGEFVKRSVIEDASGPQVLIQSVSNAAAAHAMLSARPPENRWLGIKTSADKKNRRNQYPTQGTTRELYAEGWQLEAIKANPGLANVFEPHFQQVPGVNNAVIELLQRMESVIKNVTGQSMSNTDILPQQSISGSSFNAQVEVDQQSNIPSVSLLINFWERARRQELRAIRNVYPGPMLSYMLSEKTAKLVEDFMAEDIDDSFDIRLTDLSGIPSTPTKRIEFFSNLMAAAPTPDEKLVMWEEIKKIATDMTLMDKGDNHEEELAKAENDMIDTDESLISDMKIMVPVVNRHTGQTEADPTTGQPLMEPKAKQRVQSWVNKYQNTLRHGKQHLPLITGPEMMRLGTKRAQLAAWHWESHAQFEQVQMAEEQEAAAQAQAQEQAMMDAEKQAMINKGGASAPV